jgi:mRNA interferase MazF
VNASHPRRGEVWWASLPRPLGSGPGYRRPVLVVQANPFNESRISTVVVVAITSNTRLGSAPGNVRCQPRDTGLVRDSVANVSQVLTVDKSLLTECVGELPARALAKSRMGCGSCSGYERQAWAAERSPSNCCFSFRRKSKGHCANEVEGSAVF